MYFVGTLSQNLTFTVATMEYKKQSSNNQGQQGRENHEEWVWSSRGQNGVDRKKNSNCFHVHIMCEHYKRPEDTTHLLRIATKELV